MTQQDRYKIIIRCIEKKILNAEAEIEKLQQKAINVANSDWSDIVAEASNSVAQCLYDATELRESQKRWMVCKLAMEELLK